MKHFDIFHEDLIIESIMSGRLRKINAPGVRETLNNLQHHWNQNAEEYLRIGLMPILARPFYNIKRNGVLVVGENPGNTKGEDAIRRELISMFKDNQIDPVYDVGKKEWRLGSTSRLDVRKGAKPEIFTGRAKKQESLWSTLEWIDPKRPTFTSTKGRYLFQANLNKMLEDMDQEKLIDQMYSCNWVPFPSANTKDTKIPPEIYKKSATWVENFINLTNPKLIITTGKIFNLMKTNLGATEHEDPIYTLGSKDLLPTTTRFMRTGMLNGIPVVSFLHWTGHYSGGPIKATWKDDTQRAACAERFRKTMQKSLGSGVSSVEKKTKKKPEQKKDVITYDEASSMMYKYYAANRSSLPPADSIKKVKDNIIADIMKGLTPEEAYGRYL